MKKIFIEKPSKNSDIKLFFFLAAFYTVFEILNLSKTIFFIRQSGGNLEGFPFEIFFIDWLVVILFMFFVAKNTRFLLQKNVSWRKIFLLHLVLAILINTLIRLGIETYNFLQQNESLKSLDSEALLIGFMAHIDTNYLIYFVMLFIIYAYYYIEHVQAVEHHKRNLQTQLLQTKIRLLSSQLQPHFLFNTINTIIGLIRTDQNKAQDTLANLGDFLRGTLQLNDENFIEVKQELLLLKKYLQIIKTRFEDQLVIKQSIQPASLNLKIPSLLLQPIIENSLKHGFSLLNQAIVISISIRKSADFLLIEISNNGAPLDESIDVMNKGTGISNLKERLETLYPDNYIFEIKNYKNDQEEGVVSILHLPIKH